ncbi:hypothetical protein BTA51_08360 [Hahella sp. CCB-MM4]|uniref:hypothetical protein n=1 Tax=Hahella sp. (strain CCB-MM4) TaxID=1926491 RepID=UPI000B9AAACB|nr:hypothetical protein [Hahella sp. CCB-MM4]OZG73810.1 hypothetical protein BTA51_08360 [Hahella sp. CCB-MM4]
MTQSKVNSQLEQLNEAKGRLQAQLSSSWARLECEGKKLLNSMGADLNNEDKSLTAILTRLRQKNPTLRQLTLNLDTSTYDLRERANWNLHMMSAYARMQAEKTYSREIKPRLLAMIDTLESGLKRLSEKTPEASNEETQPK